MADEGGGNIKVVVRCRPLNSRELARGATMLIRMEGNQTLLDPPPDLAATGGGSRAIEKKTHAFTFDKSYWSAGDRDEPRYCSQQTLFDDLGKELLDHGFSGFNACIVAYGQTGSGKSYSMMGYGADKGIIPLTCMELFARTASKMASDPNISFTVEVSYIEIYNEKVRDLLNPKNKGNLKVREHPSLGPYVEDLSKLVVGSYDEMMTLMDEGNKARTVAATNMNETSSRSHAVFTLLLTQKRHDTDANLDTERVSRINLVDLAGSERANSTGATGQRLKEGANINKSLTTLGKVISALALASEAKPKGKKGKAEDFIPYRDSVLTWLLKDSLGGNSKTAMIAAISPADYEETLSTLRYADQAKKIKNKAIVNEDPNARLIRELKEELEMLRSRVSGTAVNQEATFDPSVPPEKQIVTYRTKEGEIKRVTKAELQEQLQASEKIMRDLNETWEEKMTRTQSVQKEREKALEELGITVEKNMIGVHTPKKMPHLVNLNEDPLMSECLIYQLKPGSTMVGRLDSSKPATIRLSGESILDEHCVFEHVDGKVTFYAMPNSVTFLNGKQVAPNEPHRLRSGHRIILGDHHVFRFNNPEEARRKRERHKSNLHMTFTIADMNSESSTRPPSPGSSADEADVDWNFARREAALARLGMDPTLENLPDEDLNKLYDRITRAKTLRNHNARGRPGSSLSQTEDVWSESGRQFGETVTDDTSVDPGTQPSPDLRESVRDIQGHLETLPNDTESRSSEVSDGRTEDLKLEKEFVESQLRAVHNQMKRLIDLHSRGLSTTHLEETEPVLYSARQLRMIRRVLDKWRSYRSFAMSETVLGKAVLLKEANILSKELGGRVAYNFTVSAGGSLASPVSQLDAIADLDAIGDVVDPILNSSTQPAVSIKVIDKKHNAVYVWSLERMMQQIQRMRNLSTFLDRPSYSMHFSSDEPFYDSPAPQHTFIGNALLSLTSISRRISSSSVIPIFCRYTSEAIGSCRVDIKIVNISVPRGSGPASASSTRSSSPMPNSIPPISKLAFFLTIDSVKGLSSHEFSSVHLQVRLSSFVGPGVGAEEVYHSQSVDLDSATLSDLKFRRSFSIGLTPKVHAYLRTGYAPIEFYAKAKPTYLEKLERWDDLREQTGANPSNPPSPDKNSESLPTSSPPMRRSETEFIVEQTHTVVARVQIRELEATGSYEPVPVISTGHLDPGCFQLRQGLQRRISLSMSCNSGRQLPWNNVSRVVIGNIRLLDDKGRLHESSSKELVELVLTKEHLVEFRPDGSGDLVAEALWDSSAHDSMMLNRVTNAGNRVLLQLQWWLVVENCMQPIPFSIDVAVATRGRDASSPSKIMTYLTSSKILSRTWWAFRVRLTPPLTRSTTELWRLDTSEKYVRGEEKLGSWKPRGLSVVSDYERLVRTERRASDVQAVKAILASVPTVAVTNGVNPWNEGREKALLEKYLRLWQSGVTSPAFDSTIDVNGSSQLQQEPLLLVGTTNLITRGDGIAKKGYLSLLVDANQDRWETRWLVLRRPYLHMFNKSNEIEDAGIIGLEGVKIEYGATVENAFGRPSVFTLFTAANSYAFAAANTKELQSWIAKLDPAGNF